MSNKAQTTQTNLKKIKMWTDFLWLLLFKPRHTEHSEKCISYMCITISNNVTVILFSAVNITKLCLYFGQDVNRTKCQEFPGW